MEGLERGGIVRVREEEGDDEEEEEEELDIGEG